LSMGGQFSFYVLQNQLLWNEEAERDREKRSESESERNRDIHYREMILPYFTIFFLFLNKTHYSSLWCVDFL
jgi:hypothetical protein